MAPIQAPRRDGSRTGVVAAHFRCRQEEAAYLLAEADGRRLVLDLGECPPPGLMD
jgi:hypothetical protein